MGCEQPPRAWPCPTSQALSLITFSTLPQFSFCSLDEQGSVHFWTLLPLSPTTCVLDTFPLPFKISFDLLHPLHAWMAEALVGCIKSLVESIKSSGLPSSPLLSVGPLREAGSWGQETSEGGYLSHSSIPPRLWEPTAPLGPLLWLGSLSLCSSNHSTPHHLRFEDSWGSLLFLAPECLTDPCWFPFSL